MFPLQKVREFIAAAALNRASNVKSCEDVYQEADEDSLPSARNH